MYLLRHGMRTSSEKTNLTGIAFVTTASNGATVTEPASNGATVTTEDPPVIVFRTMAHGHGSKAIGLFMK